MHVSIALAGALVAMPTWVRPPTLFPLQVNTHGQLSFRTPFLNFEPEAFPLIEAFPFGSDVVLIAPFWNDIDVTDVEGTGQLFFRLSNDDTLLGVVGVAINAAFVTDFSPLALFIATWDGVPNTDNDIDVCLVATAGSLTFRGRDKGERVGKRCIREGWGKRCMEEGGGGVHGGGGVAGVGGGGGVHGGGGVAGVGGGGGVHGEGGVAGGGGVGEGCMGKGELRAGGAWGIVLSAINAMSGGLTRAYISQSLLCPKL